MVKVQRVTNSNNVIIQANITVISVTVKTSDPTTVVLIYVLIHRMHP
jgi:hypothetical protein